MEKLKNILLILVLRNERTGIRLLDNVIVDALGYKRMATKQELADIRSYIKPDYSQFYKKAA